MPEQQSFEYAVIRIVPRVEREEFLNTGVVLYCAKAKFLAIKYELNEARLRLFCPSLDMDEVRQHLKAFEDICCANLIAGPIAKLSMPERFRWLTATRSTILQCSKVHPGLSSNAEEMLEKIFAQQVPVLANE